MDDFTPYGSNFQKALTNLRKVLAKSIEMNLSLSLEKCEFLMAERTVLGHTISEQGLQLDPDNITFMQRVSPPQKVRDVWSFLGLEGYYRRFIKDFSKLASPLFCLLGKDVEFIWIDNCQEALDTLKVSTTLVLKREEQDREEKCPIHLDWGNIFKLGPDQILRRCVREEEVFDILLTCHDGPYGGHFAAKMIGFKILMGKPTPRDEMLVQPQVTFEPFEKWGMDFVGPINPPSKQKPYIIVCNDYLTKWAETKAIKVAT
eukprot:PITA_34868